MKKLIAGLLIAASLVLPISLLANELSNSTWNEVDASNNSAVPNGWPENMNASGVNDAARQMSGALKRWWNRSNSVITTSGASTHYVYTPTNASFPTAYVQGEGYCFKTDKASAGNDDFNVNALGAKPLYRAAPAGLIKLVANDLKSGQVACAYYDSALNAAAGGFHVIGTAVPTPVSFQGTPSNPAATSNVAATMMGMGATCKFTPLVSGIVRLSFDYDVTASGGPTGYATTTLQYGSGGAPANNAAVAGTQAGAAHSNNTPLTVPASINPVVSGLTVGTQYWFDLSALAFNGGSVTITNPSCGAVEIP